MLRRVKWSSGRHILAYPQILWKWATIEIETFLIKRHSNWTFLSFLFFKVGRQKLLRHPAVVDSSDGICTHLDLFTNDWTTKSTYFPKKWVTAGSENIRHIPSRLALLKMLFLFPRWDILVPERVHCLKNHFKQIQVIIVFGRTKDHHQLQRL